MSGVSEVRDSAGEVVAHAMFEQRDGRKVATIVWRSPDLDADEDGSSDPNGDR